MLDALFVVLMAAAPGQAPPDTTRFKQPYAGDCAVTVLLAGRRGGDVVQVSIDRGDLPVRSVTDDAQKELAVPTGSPLQAGETLRLAVNGSELPAATQPVAARPPGTEPTGTCSPIKGLAATGESFEASGYFGWAYDQFAPDNLGGYPPGTATAKHNRMLFGVDFAYRIFGTDESRVRLWMAGETLHGVRSADINCDAETNKPAVCTPQPGLTYTRAVLENQSSLEAYVAPRLELATLQNGSSSPALFYVTGRFGFIAMAGAPRVFKNHHAGLGLIADDGPFEGSYFEAGIGMNELLGSPKFNRLKIDGFLTFPLTKVPLIRDNANFFIQMFIDNDFKKGADSVQTFVGFDVDVRKFFGAQ
jgi:hypothetical protein